jgi:hypothetical protein
VGPRGSGAVNEPIGGWSVSRWFKGPNATSNLLVARDI